MSKWTREAEGYRANAAFCEEKAKQWEADGDPKMAAGYRKAAEGSRGKADEAEYRAKHGGRSY
jgi:hypothetical protein